MAGLQICRKAMARAPIYGGMNTAVLYRSSTSSSKDFFQKNKDLKRPMSPHVTIYKPQWTWTLSIAHRGSGLFLSAGVYAAACALAQSAGSFEAVIGDLSVHPVLGSLTKFSIAFPFVYHSMNGLRHLNWDRGSGFEIKTLERQGQIVLGSSMLISAAIAALL